MKFIKQKKILCVLFSILFFLSGCASPSESKTEEIKTEEIKTDAPDDAVITAEKTEDGFVEEEILDDITCLVSYSDSGVLPQLDSYKEVTVRTAADLNPYREFLPELTAELEKTILNDKNGKCILVETRAKAENHSFDITSVFRENGKIEILLSEYIEEETQPMHTFFLFYFPSEIYKGEPVSVLFFNP